MNLEFLDVEVPKSISGYSGVEFNRNNFTFDFTLSYAKFDQEGRSNYGIAVAPLELTTSFRSIS
jgi:hypothetical protein